MQKSIICHSCHYQWTVELPISRRDECPQCHQDAKVCLNCIFYDQTAYHHCREAEADWVKEKDLGTFCSYFQPRGESSASADHAQEEALAKLKALFGDK